LIAVMQKYTAAKILPRNRWTNVHKLHAHIKDSIDKKIVKKGLCSHVARHQNTQSSDT
jgi:hypothetical protein